MGKVTTALRRAGGDECAKAARYVEEHRDPMSYDLYLSRGLPISPGPRRRG